MCDHLGFSALTKKRVKGDNNSAIKKHRLLCNHSFGLDDFSILAGNNNDFNVTLKVSPSFGKKQAFATFGTSDD